MQDKFRLNYKIAWNCLTYMLVRLYYNANEKGEQWKGLLVSLCITLWSKQVSHALISTIPENIDAHPMGSKGMYEAQQEFPEGFLEGEGGGGAVKPKLDIYWNKK